MQLLNSLKRLKYVALFVAMVTFMEAAAIPYWMNIQSEDTRSWNRINARRAELLKPQSYDVVILGDSTSVQSVRPILFHKFTGKTAFNYGTHASSSYNDLYFASQYLKNHPAPEAFVAVKSPYYWGEEGENTMTRTYQDISGVSLKLFSKGMASLTDVGISFLQNKVLPSLYYRHEIKEILKAKKDYLVRRENQVNRKQSPGELGFEPFNTKLHNPHPEMNEKNWQILKRQLVREDGELPIHQAELDRLRMLCDITTQYNVPLYVSTSPVHPVLKNDPQIAPILTAMEERFTESLADKPLCTYWNTISLPEDQLSDPTHAIGKGVNTYTQYLAKTYKKDSPFLLAKRQVKPNSRMYNLTASIFATNDM